MLYNAYSQELNGQARSRKEPISYLNVMLIGRSGTGKTSFLRTFYEQAKQSIIQGTLKTSKPSALSDTICATEELYSISMHIEENGERTVLTIIDTPGFVHGFAIDEQVHYLSKYIDHQYERTLVEETKLRRDAKALDTHIHACLYFLEPSTTGLSDADRYVLRVLSSRVNVLPVLGKADTLSLNQRQVLKKAYRNDIFDQLQIPVYGYLRVSEGDNQEDGIDRSESTMEECDTIIEMLREDWDEDAGARAMVEYLESMPLTLMAFEEDPETGRPLLITREETLPAPKHAEHKPILGRRYPWAVVECCNPEHCDLEKLKATLLGEHRDMLRMDTFERFYERYRTERLLDRRVDRLVAAESKSSMHTKV
ncbi:Septin-domain-containing protein [Syncephalastrum racemosum]|uniref:Septin-domain-containing protein n=1 Tax=Syncephalastrum racemosum TaxID=13706 RepID=A0A1X2HAZ9_SYNRA|nr:Septin-domain-containing protein [Syncephalastrum racemosum]